MPRPRVVLILLAASLALAPRGLATSGEVTLAVPGRSNQTPWVASLGAVVAVTWGAQAPEGKADVYLAISRDGGQRFDAPLRVNTVEGDARLGGELPPRVALVPRAGGGEPAVVVAYGAKGSGTEIRVVRLEEDARTVGPTRALQAPGAPGDRGWHALALDPRGTAHVMWLDHRGLASGPAQSHAHQEKAAIDGVAMAMRSGLYYAADGAPTSARPERELVRGVCYCCKVAMAAGPNGELFAAWRHVYPGNVRDIAFLTSRDNGRTFEAPGRVSTDEWHLAGCPDDGPAMAVDGDGTIHVVWPTVVTTEAGTEVPTGVRTEVPAGVATEVRMEGALFYATSRDGRTFTPRTRIPTLGSPKPMHPQVHVDATGRVMVAWDEVVDGVRQAAVRTLGADEAGQPRFGAALRLDESATPSAYPMLVTTTRGPLAVWVSGKPGAAVIRVRGL